MPPRSMSMATSRHLHATALMAFVAAERPGCPAALGCTAGTEMNLGRKCRVRPINGSSSLRTAEYHCPIISSTSSGRCRSAAGYCGGGNGGPWGRTPCTVRGATNFRTLTVAAFPRSNSRVGQ